LLLSIRATFRARLRERSRGNFRYLTYVLADVADATPGAPLDLDARPDGLEAYYGHFWDQLQGELAETFTDWKRLYRPVIERLAVSVPTKLADGWQPWPSPSGVEYGKQVPHQLGRTILCAAVGDGAVRLAQRHRGSTWYLDTERSPSHSRKHSVDRPVPQTYHIECVATLERASA
jgi:hypothetical protein